MAGDALRVVLNPAAIHELLHSPSGPVGRDLVRRAQRVTAAAKARAPVSTPTPDDRAAGHRSGELRNSIYYRLAADPVGLYADVVAGASYALYVEFATRPHQIRARDANALSFFWPKVGMRTLVPKGGSRHTGPEHGVFVIGKGYVDHPGTTAQPFLRPALAAVKL